MSDLGARLSAWREPVESLRQALAKDELTLGVAYVQGFGICQPHLIGLVART